jgi:hypothetical protein
LLSAPARAEDSLFDKASVNPPATAPAEQPKPAAKHKHAAKHKPASKATDAATVAPAPADLPPVVVQEPAPEPQTAFGHQMPRQSLINRIMNPTSASGQGDQPGGKPGAAPAAEPEEETLPNGMPRKFLLNRLFDSSALEPSQPDPRSFMAQAQTEDPNAKPAPLSSWWDSATSAVGLGGKQETPAGNLPPVNVTAPAKPDRTPATATPAPAPAPSSPSWFDRATGAIGLGGGNEPIPDYSERPKLAIPQNRDALPPPNPREERRVQAPANAEALTRPPAAFTEKVRGPDGNVSGFTDQDEGKKGWFNWF